MSISSMTGFARAGGEHQGYGWTWEVRSVNGRGLDVRCRLGGGNEGLEPAVRDAVSARFARGHVSVNLQVDDSRQRAAVRVNAEVLAQLIAAAQELRSRLPEAGLSVDGLLGLRGVLESVEPDETDEARAARETSMLASLEEALQRLRAARSEEGARLAQVLEAQLDEMETVAVAAARCSAAQPQAIRERLQQQVADLVASGPGLTEDRLAQEVALLAVKGDVREELDRLAAHIEAARELVVAEDAAGRRLDFLAQEFNREANTLCAKAADVELTRRGLELKALIDRFREQVQNIE